MTRQFTDSSQVYLNLTNFAGWNTNKTLMTSVTRNLFSRSAWRINLNDRYRFARAFVDRSPISRPVFVVIVIIPIWCEWNKRKKNRLQCHNQNWHFVRNGQKILARDWSASLKMLIPVQSLSIFIVCSVIGILLAAVLGNDKRCVPDYSSDDFYAVKVYPQLVVIKHDT